LAVIFIIANTEWGLYSVEDIILVGSLYFLAVVYRNLDIIGHQKVS